jgi:ATP-binding cassette subfamily B protein
MVVLMSAVQIYLLARLHQAGEITAGGFAFIAIITLNLHSQLSGLLERLLFTVNPAFASMKASYDFINRSYDVCDKVGAKKIGKARGEIVYSDVTFSYGDQNKIIFKDFNLHVKQGERLGIVGKTGAGNSTLINRFLRYLDLEKGYISIDGDRIIDITQESLWQNVSLVPQDITMFHRTIRENLLIAKSDASDEEMFAACKLANIHDDILLMRGGYNSVVGERGAKLSGGQRQRIALARAVLKNASIMILDEATSSLDTQTEQLIQASIHNVLESSGATVLVVAHRLSTLRHMDRIIVLDKGTIVEEGSHEDLIGNENGLYFKLWNAQVGLQQI